jgi:hypothetical protein
MAFLFSRRSRDSRSMRQRRSFVLRLETLEDRSLPSTLTVLNNLDGGAGSLRDAISHAKDGDTIVFAPSLDGQTIPLTSAELAIKSSVDIEGPGADKLAVSGNDTNRIFDISEGNTVTIAGLTITHGRAAGKSLGGGGILNVGSILTVANDVLSYNEAIGGNGNPAQGGAIANHNGATLSAINSKFVGDQALASTSGGTASGGAILNGSFDNGIDTHATVSGCTFVYNRAVGADGGIVSGYFENGDAVGGGIYNDHGGMLTVLDSTFAANQAIAGNGGSGGKFAGGCLVDVAIGGGISNNDVGTTLVVSGSTFSYNLAVGGSNASGSTGGPGHVGTGAGGGVGNLGVATVTNSTFDHNQALGGSGNTGSGPDTDLGRGVGGAIQNTAFAGAPATLAVSGCAFTNNQAIGGTGNAGTPFVNEGLGGALDNIRGATATVTGSTFTGNQAIGGTGGTGQDGGNGLGGALANVLGSALTVSGCTLSGNFAIGGAGGAGANGGNGLGGGLYNDGSSTLTVTSSTITSNSATGGAAGGGRSAGLGIGGGVYFASGGVVCLDLFTSLNITGNTATTSNNDVFGIFTIC